jgi:hypothetical protein
MRTAIGATTVNIAEPTNLSARMIHAFLDNVRYITIELNGSTQYDTRDDVPCPLAGRPHQKTRHMRVSKLRIGSTNCKANSASRSVQSPIL